MTHLMIVATAAATILVAVTVLQQRRTPQSAAAWLLFMVVVPYLALPLFLVLGFRKRGSGYSAIAFSAAQQAAGGAETRDDPFRHFGVPAASDGHRVELHRDGADAWTAVKALVDGAAREIDATFYVIADDAVGRDFVERLTARARDGVRVRLVIDRLGSLKHPAKALAALRDAGGEIRYFSPFLQAPERGHVNLRNHRKLILADGARVFSGGRNIGAHYMEGEAEPGSWVDLSYTLEGPAVRSFADVFRADWGAGHRRSDLGDPGPPEPAGSTVAQLVPCGPDSPFDPLHDGLVTAIHSAQRRVWIATPYFLPTEYLEHALASAARRGIDVTILVPRKSNQPLTDLARGSYLRSLEAAGCRVLLYGPRMMHAKAGVIDDLAWVGSANFDIRSMLLNFELTLFVYDGAGVAQISDWFAGLAAQSQAGAPRAGLARRLTEGVFRLGAPIL